MRGIGAIVSLCLVFLVCLSTDGLTFDQVHGVVHVHSYISSGDYSPEYVLDEALKEGFPVVIFTENILLKWEYGIWPLRNLVKKKIEMDSLLNYGVKKYFKKLKKLRKEYPGIVIIPSAEVAPIYYWTGNPFKKTLTMNQWDQQLLVMGLDNPKDYKNIPFVSNTYRRDYSVKSFLLMWPVFTLLFGVWWLKKSPEYRHPALGIIVVSSLFLLNNFPFSTPAFDQYHGDQGVKPHQDVIDYVNEKGGITFWSAPEADTDVMKSGVRILSPSYERDLIITDNYTGFAAFYEGYREVGGPEGVWDEILEEYCKGNRKSPIWAIGEMAYHGSEAGGRKALGDVQTVFLLDEITNDTVLNALKKGKMFALWQKDYALTLEEFSAENDSAELGVMGDEIVTGKDVWIRAKVSNTVDNDKDILVKVIKNGKVLKEYTFAGKGEVSILDEDLREDAKNYYRVEISSDYPHRLITNPIFVVKDNSVSE